MTMPFLSIVRSNTYSLMPFMVIKYTFIYIYSMLSMCSFTYNNEENIYNELVKYKPYFGLRTVKSLFAKLQTNIINSCLHVMVTFIVDVGL